ncbi:MAG: NAD(P)H-dependent oxidoreductase [Pyrinomonadaceae bacterium]|nr:NAD(P)H-dependent oxidoreductase [Pyrinomonadaceae bacterium]
MTNEELIQQLKWRDAVKRFDSTRKISQNDWQTLEEALILTPSSGGLQPWKFYVVTDEKLKRELQPHARNQLQIVESSHLVVIAARKEPAPEIIEKYINRISQVRGTPLPDLEIFKQNLLNFQQKAIFEGTLHESAKRQCYIALGFLLTSAAMLGIDACPMEGFDPEGFNQVLGIEKEGFNSVVIAALGYRSNDDWLSKLPKVRFEKDELVKHF